MSAAKNCAVPVIFGLLVLEIVSYRVNLGDCVVYYDEPCSSSDIQFYLYTTTDARVTIHALDPFHPVLPYGFNVSTPLKILVHGYGGLSRDFTIKNVSGAYREIGYNVIIVDWSAMAVVPCYPAAYLNTWHVGQCTAVLSVSLAMLGILPSMVHILGFSLGSHIASFASNHLQKVLGIPYQRITGLDPALPFFATLNNEWKLDPSDASFVDVVHTSAGSFGKLEAMGHVDFYVNGGALQPACSMTNYPPLCSHLIVGLYFANTVRSRKYYGFECPSILHYNFGLCDPKNASKSLMGEYANPNSRGIYFVDISLPRSIDLTEITSIRL